MKLTSSRETREICKELVKLGWIIRRGRKHIVACSPAGNTVTLAATPSDYRGLKNTMKCIKRIIALEAKQEETYVH